MESSVVAWASITTKRKAPRATGASLLRQELKEASAEKRRLQRLEWRWQRDHEKWRAAASTVQRIYRGRLGRKAAKHVAMLRGMRLRAAENGRQAEVLAGKGAFAQALELADAGLKMYEAENTHLLSLRAGLLLYARRFHEAIVDCDVLLAEDHTNAGALRVRGRALVALQRWDDAAVTLSKALRLCPGDRACYLLRGFCLSKLARIEEAVADYDTMVRTSEPRPGAVDYGRRGLGKSCMQEWGAAGDDFGDAARVQEESGSTWLTLRSRAYACDRNWVAANDAATEALKMDKAFDPAKQMLLELGGAAKW